MPANIPIMTASRASFLDAYGVRIAASLARIADEPRRDHVFAR
jgi:hypothetical protein